MNLSVSKLIAALSMSIVTFLCNTLPIVVFRRPENEGGGPRNFRVVHFLNCFGGGVFMATCLLHLLPDVQEQVVTILKKLGSDLNYPLAELLSCGGFLIVLIAEQIVLSCREKGHDKIANFTHHHSHEEPLYQNYDSINDDNTENSNLSTPINVNESEQAIQPGESRHDKIANFTHQHSHGEPLYQNYGSINQNTENLNPITPINISESEYVIQPHEICHNQISNFTHQHSHGEPLYQNTENSTHGTPINVSESEYVIQPDEESNGHPHEVSLHQDPNSHSVLRSLLLLFALSLHSIFEGLAIGLQLSVENVGRIAFAVSIHKCIIAFTLGMKLTHSNLKRANAIIGSIFFSLASPTGIIIGLVVVDFVTGLPMLISSAILQGIATGTFLYVTFFEILPHELNSREDRLLKMFFLIFGFSGVAVLILFVPD